MLPLLVFFGSRQTLNSPSINRSTASWPLEPPSDQEGWRHVRLQQAGKNASGQTHYLSLSGFEVYGTVMAAVEEPLGESQWKSSCSFTPKISPRTTSKVSSR